VVCVTANTTAKTTETIEMDRLLEFSANHFWLVSAFWVVLSALMWTLLGGALRNSLSPAQSVLLLNKESGVPVDVRSEANYRAGHIINAVHLDLAHFDETAKKLDKFKTKPLLVYCETGTTASKAVKKLRQAGFGNVVQLQGGIAAWRQENLPLEKSK
jgi:rhodanese-related sulfurtransferase